MRLPNRSRALALLFLAMACEPPAPVPATNHPAPAGDPAPRAEDSAALAALSAKLGSRGVLTPTISAVIPSVDSSITLARWLASHPGDVVTGDGGVKRKPGRVDGFRR